jgi:chromosome segregation ATPase
MKTTTIVVRAGRTFNHPYESYSNLKPEVELRAELADGDDALACTRQLQAQAEGLVEDHKRGLLNSIEELQRLSTHQQELRSLQSELERTQRRIEAIRGQHPELGQLPPATGEQVQS